MDWSFILQAFSIKEIVLVEVPDETCHGGAESC